MNNLYLQNSTRIDNVKYNLNLNPKNGLKFN
jgi:hypothetical protein